MRRQLLRDLIGTAVVFVILSVITFALIYADFLLDVTKAHKAGG